jgi:endoglucanase
MTHSLTPVRPSRRRFLIGGILAGSLGALGLAACGPTTPPRAVPSPAPAMPTASSGASPGSVAPTPLAPTSASAATPTPRPAPLNYLHTHGASILDVSEQLVTLTGLNWFGMETSLLAPHGLWARSYGSMLDQIVQAGYNCLRLPYSNDLFNPKLFPNGIDFKLNPDLEGMTGLQIMDTIVLAAAARGLKIILDQHRPTIAAQSQLWYTDELSQDMWIQQWQALATRYQGNDAVIGADLHNEPCGPATWGSGDPKTDWALAATACGNAVLAINPNWLILVEGVEKLTDKSGNPLDWTWQGGELMTAGKHPIELQVPNRVVYSPHDYGPSVSDQGWFHAKSFPDNLPGFWDEHWGYLAQTGIAPVLVGEFGGPSVGTDTEGEWQRSLVAYLKAHGLSYTYWCWNPNSSDTGGLLEDDWRTIHPAKQALLATYQGNLLSNRAPTVINRDAVPPVNAQSHTAPWPAPTPVPSATAAPTTAAPLTPMPTATAASPTPTSLPSFPAAAGTNGAVPILAGPMPTASAVAPTATPVVTSGRVYVVQSGDTLSSIAQKVYGDATAWRRIAAANASQVPNPDVIRPGQRLTLP